MLLRRVEDTGFAMLLLRVLFPQHLFDQIL